MENAYERREIRGAFQGYAETSPRFDAYEEPRTIDLNLPGLGRRRESHSHRRRRLVNKIFNDFLEEVARIFFTLGELLILCLEKTFFEGKSSSASGQSLDSANNIQRV